MKSSLIALMLLGLAVGTSSCGTPGSNPQHSAMGAIEAGADMALADGKVIEEFPLEAVPLVAGEQKQLRQPKPKRWNLKLTTDQDIDEVMAEGCQLLKKAGFVASGIQTASMTQWRSDAYAVTLTAAPVPGAAEQLLVKYSVTQY
jgi:hypothetical protein